MELYYVKTIMKKEMERLFIKGWIRIISSSHFDHLYTTPMAYKTVVSLNQQCKTPAEHKAALLH